MKYGSTTLLVPALKHAQVPVCPDYIASGFTQDTSNSLRANISFGLEVGKVPFGTLIRQEISFLPVGVEETLEGRKERLVWEIPHFLQHGRWSANQVLPDRHKASLRMSQSYLPKIRVISEVMKPIN